MRSSTAGVRYGADLLYSMGFSVFAEHTEQLLHVLLAHMQGFQLASVQQARQQHDQSRESNRACRVVGVSLEHAHQGTRPLQARILVAWASSTAIWLSAVLAAT